MRAAIRVPEFRALLSSYVINRAGDVVGALALAVVVLDVTGSALATALLFVATQFLPGLVGPLLVTRLDRRPPSRLLVSLYLVEAGLFAALAALVHHAPVPVLILLAFLDASIAFVARTLTRATTATVLLPHDLMPEGKAAFNVALAAAMVAGPVAGGLMVALLGAGPALLLDAASFLVAALIVVRAPRLPTPVTPAGERGRLRAGLRYIARHPALRLVIGGEGLAFVLFYMVVPVTVVFAAESLHAGAGGYAAILAAWGVGIALGSALQARLARRAGPGLILAATAAVAVGYLGTGAAPTLAVACLASVVGGAGNGMQWASVEIVLHGLVDEAYRTRATAVLEALAAIAPGIGIVLGGALTSAFSPRAAYLVAGGGLLVLVIGVAAAIARSGRGPRRVARGALSAAAGSGPPGR
jgi:MFS family permease